MDAKTKDILRALGIIVFVLGMIWLFVFTNHAYPENNDSNLVFDKEIGFVPVMATILLVGVLVFLYLIDDDESDKPVYLFILVLSLIVVWLIALLYSWNIGDHWYTQTLKFTVFVCVMIIVALGIDRWA